MQEVGKISEISLYYCVNVQKTNQVKLGPVMGVISGYSEKYVWNTQSLSRFFKLKINSGVDKTVTTLTINIILTILNTLP